MHYVRSRKVQALDIVVLVGSVKKTGVTLRGCKQFRCQNDNITVLFASENESLKHPK
jgi:hypothetical protein